MIYDLSYQISVQKFMKKNKSYKQSIAKYHCQAQHKFQFNLADIAFHLEGKKYITEETDIT